MPRAPAVYGQVELHVALEHTLSEKKAEQEKALTIIQEEENHARELCKVRAQLRGS